MIEPAQKIEPIKAWRHLIESDLSRTEMEKGLKDIYTFSIPDVAGMILSGYCRHNCQHCIYHPDYPKYCRDLPAEQWKTMLRGIYEDLSIRLFIDNGRSFTRKNFEVIKFIKESLPETLTGLIGNGPDLFPCIDELDDLEIDWIDVSVDGMEEEHDRQRNQKGSFKGTLETILKLHQKRIAPKLSILTCLTTINKSSIAKLIQFYNERGIENFFLSPVSVLKGYGPSDKLKISGQDLAEIIENIHGTLNELKNTRIEIDLFDATYLHYIKYNNETLWHGFFDNYDHMSWMTSTGDNEFHINYFPLSMSGTKELIINCNGDVIPPLVMAKGNISEEDLFGSLLLTKPSEIIYNMPLLHGFKIFFNSLFDEKFLLKGEFNNGIR